MIMTEQKLKRIDEILADIREEVIKASTKHAPMNSPHEGISVLKEEVDELWDEVKQDTGRLGPAKREAIQISAMGVRYILDLCEY